MITLAISCGLVLLWFLLFSGLSWRVRRLVCAVLAVAALLGLALFKYDGVSGDLIPKFRWRWGNTGPPPLQVTAADGAQVVPAPPGAADFPQFLGPHRNCRLDEPDLETDWKTHPPQELWRLPVGKAWTGFAVSAGMAITQEQREDQELVVCYQLDSGKILWSHADATRHEDPLGGVGPRANPLIADGRVFTQGATGILNCLDLATGRVVWSKDILTGNGAKRPEYGVSASPLLVGEMVVVMPGNRSGATLAAYHRDNGTRLWIGGTQSASYSSPVVAAIGGVEQVLHLGRDALVSYEPTNGKVLWEFPAWPQNQQPNIAVPVTLSGDRVLISSGYGRGSRLAEIKREGTAWTAQEGWSTNRMKAKFTNLAESGGLVYGLDDGVLACLDPADGQLKWRGEKYGHGQVLFVKSRLLIMAEDGSVVQAEVDGTGMKELGRFQALNEKTWNPPALAGNYLVVRNDQEAVCYRLPVRT